MDYVRVNKSNELVVAYVKNSDYPTEQEQQNKLNEVFKLLVPGDVIVYRYSSSGATVGHAMLYLGNNQIIHATGKSYDWNNKIDNFDVNGALRIENATEVFTNKNHDRYLFRPSREEFAIIRPLVYADFSDLTNYSKSRNMVNGLDVEKKANIPNFSAVSINQEITYTLTIKNTSSSDLKNFYIKDQLSANEEFVVVGVGGQYLNSELSFYVDLLSPGQTKEFTYTVKAVKTSLTNETLISSQTRVYELYFNALAFSIVEYSQEDLTALENKIVNSLGTGRNLRELLEYLYGEEHPIESGSITDIYNNKEDLRAYFLWGGYDYDKTSLHNAINRTRVINENYLVTGDIIIISIDGSKSIYFYSPTKIISYSNGNVYEETLSLEELLGYDSYKIIRPTFIK